MILHKTGMFIDDVAEVGRRVEELLVSCCRLINADERAVLEKNSNVVSGNVYVAKNGACLLDHFKSNVFLNSVVLAFIPGQVTLSASSLPAMEAGVYNCTLSNVVIDGTVFAKDCALIHACYIASNCALISNGVIGGCFSKHLYGFGSEVVLCEETGTRAILSSPELTLDTIVAAVSSTNEKRKIFIASVESEKDQIVNKIALAARPFMGTVIGSKCFLLKNTKLESVFLKPGTNLSSSQLANCVVNETCTVENSCAINSVIHCGVVIENFAFVENSILFDFSKVAVHGKVVHSAIGSYSGVESGECVSSLIGPFVGFHHQSLCIATFWPQGRGNIGYGANVGSNHSGKAPDCELFCGEGIFFGLATVIKFPCNFSRAVYSLIASGVTCLPQRMDFPFSLINSPSSGSSGGLLNEVFPAWVLSDNMFTLLRNEEKFKQRQKKECRFVYDHRVFRKDTISLVLEARNRLHSVPLPYKAVYTETDIPGLGKNYLTEASRLRAVDTYSFILRWYGLRGLYRSFVEAGPVVDQEEYTFCMEILKHEGMNLNQPKSLLEEFSKLDFLISSNCVASKTKDDVRGSKIIGPTYSEFHAPASQHPVCVSARRNSAQVEETVAKIVAKL